MDPTVFEEPRTFPITHHPFENQEVQAISQEFEKEQSLLAPQPFFDQSIKNPNDQDPHQPEHAPFQPRLHEQKNSSPQNPLVNTQVSFDHQDQRSSFDTFAQQHLIENQDPSIFLQRSNVNKAQQKTIIPKTILLRNPSDYIFLPQKPVAPTPFDIETGDFLFIPDAPSNHQTQQFLFNSQETFVNQIHPAVFEDVSQQPRQQKSFEPSIFQQNTFGSTNPQQNEITQNIPGPNQSQQTLFQSINQEAVDRPVRKKLSEESNLRTVPKSAALQLLVKIAGADWDTSLHTGKSILGTSSTSFQCPSLEGDYPDPGACSVYYQCAQGVAHQHTCQEGLNWNMVINMCDWEANVDCEINKGNRDVPPPSEDRPRQVMSQPFTSFGL